MGKPGGRGKKKNAGVGVDFKKVKHKVRSPAGPASGGPVLAAKGCAAMTPAAASQPALPPAWLLAGRQKAAAGPEPDGHKL